MERQEVTQDRLEVVSSTDSRYVPTCSKCGEKHWPFHPLVPCVNFKKAKTRAKDEKKAIAEANRKAEAEAKAKAIAEKKAAEEAFEKAQYEAQLRADAERQIEAAVERAS